MKAWLISVLIVALAGCQAATIDVGLSTAATLSADSLGYRYVQGELWQGVKIGGQAPRTSSSICYRQECYRLNYHVSLPRQTMRRYQLQTVDFSSLAAASGVTRQGDELQLPAELGRYLFNEARRRFLRKVRRL